MTDAAINGWVAAWNEPDGPARAALLERWVSEDCLFVGPTGPVRGRPGLHAAIAEARDYLPGAEVVRTGPVEQEAGEVRFAWEVRAPEGGRVMAGVDRVELDDEGRLTKVVVLPSG